MDVSIRLLHLHVDRVDLPVEPEGPTGHVVERDGGPEIHAHIERRLAILHRLIDQADVFLINLPRQASLDKYGLSVEACQARNPRLIHVSITGFGRSGPYADRSGFDIIAQAMGGLGRVTGIGSPLEEKVTCSAGITCSDRSSPDSISSTRSTRSFTRVFSRSSHWRT